MTPFLEARGVSKRFPSGEGGAVRAVDGVSLVVERGAFVLLTGPSGSGKTTLLALLGTLERPSEGTVLVDGVDPSTVSEGQRSRLRRRLGFAFPGGPMLPRLPLWENVTLGLVPEGRGVAERREAAAAVLERLGLGERLRAAPETLSTGEMQRATLARALVGGAEALLVDEPLASLDPESAERVVAELAAYHAAGGTVLCATHVTAPFTRATTTLRMKAGTVLSS